MIPRTQDLHENTKCFEWYIESLSFTFLLIVFKWVIVIKTVWMYKIKIIYLQFAKGNLSYKLNN